VDLSPGFCQKFPVLGSAVFGLCESKKSLMRADSFMVGRRLGEGVADPDFQQEFRAGIRCLPAFSGENSSSFFDKKIR